MSVSNRTKAEEFKESVEAKIRDLVLDFSKGNISREQFQVIYERYNNQLDMANQALYGSNAEALDAAQTGPSTVAIRQSLMGKAIGMAIYHNKSGTMIETLGDFEVPVHQLSARLNDISMQIENRDFVETVIEKLSNEVWLVYAAGKFTTIVTVFRNEPSQMQTREINRLHHDFEQANASNISKERVDASKLAYPFMVFIKKKIRQ